MFKFIYLENNNATKGIDCKRNTNAFELGENINTLMREVSSLIN